MLYFTCLDLLLGFTLLQLKALPSVESSYASPTNLKWDDDKKVCFLVTPNVTQNTCLTNDSTWNCKHCNTLEYYANNSAIFENYTNSSVWLMFIKGIHKLDNNVLNISQVKNLTLMPSSTGNKVDVRLSNSNMTFTCILLLRIKSMEITSLGGSEMVHFSTKPPLTIELQKVTFKSVSVVIEFGKSYSMINETTAGAMRVEISEAQFVKTSLQFNFANVIAGFETDVNISITHSIYELGGKTQHAFLFCSVNMSHVFLFMDHVTVSVTGVENARLMSQPQLIAKCSDSGLGEYDQSDILIVISSDNFYWPTEVLVYIANGNFTGNSGAGIQSYFYGHMSIVNVTIKDSALTKYKEGGLYVYIGAITMSELHIVIKQISIEHCSSNYGSSDSSAISIVGNYYSVNNTSDIKIQECMFINNQDLQGDATTVWLYNFKRKVLIANCLFHGNTGTAIQAYNTDLYLSGWVYFSENTAYQGGALKLTNSKIIVVDSDTQLFFQGNYANETGGGIYVDVPKRDLYEESRYRTNVKCVYQLESSKTLRPVTPIFYLINNTASHGGDHIYGFSLHSCCTVYVNPDTNAIIRSYDIQHLAFHLDPYNFTGQHSLISSNPTRLCFCDSENENQANCSSIRTHRTISPGEKFSVKVIAVGAYFGRSTGTVYSDVVSKSSEVSLNSESGEKIKDTSKCTKIEYSVSANSYGSAVVVLSVDRNIINQTYNNIEDDIDKYQNDSSKCIPQSLLTTNIYIDLTLEECPIGFSLSRNVCECNCFDCNSLKCTVKDGLGYIHRTGNTWVYISTDNATVTSTITVVHDCPFDYCQPLDTENFPVNDNTNFSLDDPQCQFNRSGVLCGECKDGLSLALGSSKCLENCKSQNLSLLILFILLGPLLVLLIKTLDFTVQQGTINGLIFYSNVVWIYKSVFFASTEHSGDNIIGAAKIFIAWLNLDFGIEVCFHPDLDAYKHTWLQFLFPLYIWCIMITIIIACRFSRRMTYLFGSNSVPVLATLFLLSYVKLLRTITAAFYFTILNQHGIKLQVNADNSEIPCNILWSVNGNICFFSIKHCFLMTVAACVFLLLCFPYTFILLFEKCLVKCNNCRCLLWMNKLKPFFDAYFGPLKDQHRYWIGLLLLIRLMLVVTFTVLPTNRASTGVFIMTVTTALLMCYSTLSLYKNWAISILENTFLTNLLILGILFQIFNQKSPDFEIAVSAFVGIAFLQFIAIAIFHLWTKQLIKIRHYCHRYTEIETDQETDYNQPPGGRQVTYQNIDISTNSENYQGSGNLRESILTD